MNFCDDSFGSSNPKFLFTVKVSDFKTVNFHAENEESKIPSHFTPFVIKLDT
jgi:hypothetical protein